MRNETCEGFFRFAKALEPWLRKWIELPNGISRANHTIDIPKSKGALQFESHMVFAKTGQEKNPY